VPNYEHSVTMTFSATNSAGTTAVDVEIIVRNCKKETFTIPVRPSIYVVLDDTYVDSLSQANWAVPNPSCGPYYFGIEATNPSRGAVTFGGLKSAGSYVNAQTYPTFLVGNLFE